MLSISNAFALHLTVKKIYLEIEIEKIYIIFE